MGSFVRQVLRELDRRERRLTRFGLGCVVLGVACLAVAPFDPRLFDGISVWLKPAKFYASVGIFALTAAWFFGLVRPERRNAPVMRAMVSTLIASGAFELAYITLQAARGQASHFNTAGPVYSAMYTAMAVGAVLLISTNLVLAWEIARRPVPDADGVYRLAVVLGLVLTVALGGTVGGYMGSQPGHAVGTHGAELAVLGWNREGGDLRVPHFFGMHSEQVLPLVGYVTLALPRISRLVAVWFVAAVWSAFTLYTLAQAVGGRAFAW